MRRRDLIGVLVVAGSLAGLLAYRHWFIEPREWGVICAAAVPPLACWPREGLLWMQYQYLWGGAALALGLWGFIGAPFAVPVAGVAIGAAAVVNYNATWGMLGLALAGWGWLRMARGRAAA